MEKAPFYTIMFQIKILHKAGYPHNIRRVHQERIGRQTSNRGIPIAHRQPKTCAFD
jgi:hypothetical protein